MTVNGLKARILSLIGSRQASPKITVPKKIDPLTPTDPNIVETWHEWSIYGGGHAWTYNKFKCGCIVGKPDDNYGGHSNKWCKEHAPRG